MLRDSFIKRSFAKINLIFFITILIMSGCASMPLAPSTDDLTAKKFIPAQNRSLIYLYRDEIFGAAIPMRVFIDGQLAGQTGPLSYFLWDVLPGEHTIKSVAENETSLKLITQPGKVYYVRQEVKMGMLTARSKLYQVDEQTGKEAINKCKLLTSTVFDAILISKGAMLASKGETSLAAGSSPSKEPVTQAKIDEKIISGAKPSTPEEIPKVIPKSGYTLEFEPAILSLQKGDYESAFRHADFLYRRTEQKDGPKQNKYLSLLERGKIALMAGQYDRATADLQEAERRFLTIEGTISIVEGFGSLLLDDTVMEYEAEMHEKLMISPYLVLAYLGQGNFDGAKVERNRTINKIHQYIDEKPQERAYLENPFARYLSALIYEMEEKTDDAKIEYRKLKLEREVERLENKKSKTTDLVIFIETGHAPQKYEKRWGPQQIPTPQGTITLGFTYAGYAPLPSEVSTPTIYINDKLVGESELLYDLEKTILTQYEKNKASLESKLVARMTAKALTQMAAKMAAKEALKKIPFASMFADMAVDAAAKEWLAMEKADLRGWMTLPKKS